MAPKARGAAAQKRKHAEEPGDLASAASPRDAPHVSQMRKWVALELNDEIAKLAQVPAKYMRTCVRALVRVLAQKLRTDKKFTVPHFLLVHLRSLPNRSAHLTSPIGKGYQR